MENGRVYQSMVVLSFVFLISNVGMPCIELSPVFTQSSGNKLQSFMDRMVINRYIFMYQFLNYNKPNSSDSLNYV